jgi:hypothetical protein
MSFAPATILGMRMDALQEGVPVQWGIGEIMTKLGTVTFFALKAFVNS